MASVRAPTLCLHCQSRFRTATFVRIDDIASKKLSNTAFRPQLRDRIEVAPADDPPFPVHAIIGSIAGRRTHGQNVLKLNERLHKAEQQWREESKVPISGTPSHAAALPQRNGDIHATELSICKWFREKYPGPIPHTVFRELMRASTLMRAEHKVRMILRMQLLHCNTPQDIQRVVAVALQRSFSVQCLASVYEPLMRAMFRCRSTVDDSTVLVTLTGLMDRLEIAGASMGNQLVRLGLKFAARVRDLRLMKKYLKAMRVRRIPMSANLFVSVIAKCSVGSRGLGEIRNGRWRRSDLLQVLTGFDDCEHLPSGEQYHLETWLTRDEWPMMHAWTAALARCRDRERLLHEWEMWKRQEDRIVPKTLMAAGGWQCWVTSRRRGDHWLLEQTCLCGDLQQAWNVLRESDMEFKDVKTSVKLLLLDGVEYAGSAWNEDVRTGLLEKYHHELDRIEKALGVTWVPTDVDDDGQGYHVLVKDQEEVLDDLGSNDYKFDGDYGYPYDKIPLVPSAEERQLHNATVTTTAAK